MNTDDLRIRRWGTIDDGYLGPAFHMRFKPGQVLYGSRRTYLRKVAVPDFAGICANTTFVLEAKDPAVLLPELLPFLMQTEAFSEHSIKQSKGSVNPYVNFSDLAWYEFALPPLEEQRRIAAVLMAIDSAVEAIHDLESGLDRMRKTFIIDRFSQLLEDDSASRVKVAQAGEVLMGRQRAPQYDQGISPRPYLRVANVYDGYVDTSDVKQMDFSAGEFKQYRLKHGDILLVEGHSSAEVVGRSCIFKDEVADCCIQNTLIRFRPAATSSEYAHKFFQYCLYARRFSMVAKQTTIAHLGANRFASMDFPLPNPEQENEIVGTILQIEANARQTAERKENLRLLKNSVFAENMPSTQALESVGL
jgi:type I restriction enzyme S subunit